MVDGRPVTADSFIFSDTEDECTVGDFDIDRLRVEACREVTASVLHRVGHIAKRCGPANLSVLSGFIKYTHQRLALYVGKQHGIEMFGVGLAQLLADGRAVTTFGADSQSSVRGCRWSSRILCSS